MLLLDDATVELDRCTLHLVILNSSNSPSLNFVGVTNNSADSEIIFLFLTSCYPQIVSLDIYTTFQTVIIKKLLNSRLTCVQVFGAGHCALARLLMSNERANH